MKGKAGKESRKAGKGREKGTEHTQKEGAGAHHLHSVDTMKGRQPATSLPVFLPAFQKYVYILPFVVSEIPEKTPKHTKEKFTFATFYRKFAPIG